MSLTFRLRRVAVPVALVLGLLLTAGWVAQAQSAGRFFPPTGHSVGGLFLTYWDGHGGLAQQGYPLTEPFQETSDLNGQTYTVQYFERAVFEQHPENASPFNVLLSQLGTFRYRAKYPTGAPGQQVSSAPGALLFKETGHTVGGKFLTYWQGHGGLAQQGFPISDEFTEVSDLNSKPYTVQYFERAVFELHPENAPPFDVLLSQLGTYQLRQKYANGVPGGADATVTAGPTAPAGTPGTPEPVGTPVPALSVHDLLAKSDAAMNALTSMKQHAVNETTDGGVKTQDLADYFYQAPDRLYLKVVSPRQDGTHTAEVIRIGTMRYERNDALTQWKVATDTAYKWPDYNKVYVAEHSTSAAFNGQVSLNGVPAQIVRVLIPIQIGNTSYTDQMIDYYISTVDYHVLREVTTVAPLPAANRTASGLYISDLFDFNVPNRIGPPGSINP
ncbi:MAG: hypothetical protein M3Z04_11285 [Chloroflexota bacterium]|nr:hypothetical protein [Chloroflexota bacterium]